jgi:hypothetical protein
MQLLFTEYILLKSLCNVMFIKRWIYLIRNKEASHPMNSVCVMSMFVIVVLCMILSGPPSDSTMAVAYVLIVSVIDVGLLVASTICVSFMKKYTKKIFPTQELFDNYVTSLSIKLLKIFPIPVDMEGEYIHFKEEEELRRQQAKLKKAKTPPAVEPNSAAAPGGNTATATLQAEG